MPTVDNLNIQIKANTTSAIKSLDALEQKLSKVSASLGDAMGSVTKNNTKVASSSTKMVSGLNKTSSAMNKASKSAKSLAASFGLFYANFFLLIRGFKSLWSSIESTADYIEAYNYFNVALGKIGADWKHQFEQYGYEDAKAYAESFSTRLQQSLGRLSGIQIVTTEDGKGLLTETGMSNLGMNIKEITQYASKLASVTNSVGQTAETSLAVSSAFTKLAGDVSSLFNLDYSAVSKNFQSGLIGQSRALYRYGLDITNATLQTYAYGLELEKAVSEMTQAEKMQLRVLAILDQSKVAWGDLANTIESPSNQIRIFKNNMSELGIIIGQLFIPMLTKVLPILNGISVAFKRIAVDIATFFGVQLDLDAFGQGYTDLEEDIDGVADSMEDATNATKKFKNATLGIDELNILGNQQNGTGLTQDTLDLTNKIVDATKKYEQAWSDAFALMEKRVESFASKFESAFAPLKNFLYHLSIGDFEGVGNDVSNMAIGFAKLIEKALEKVDWNKVGKNIGDFLAGIDWEETLKSVGDVVFKAVEASIEQWSGAFSVAPIETTVITAIAALKWSGLGTAIMTSLGNSLKSATGAFMVSIGSWFELNIPKVLPFIASGFSILSPGMIGELGIWLERVLKGTFLDPSTWTGVARDLYDGSSKLIDGFFDGIVYGLQTGFSKVLNYDTTLATFSLAGNYFSQISEAFKKQDWLSVATDVLLGISYGLGATLYMIVEPIIDLFEWTGKALGIQFDGIEKSIDDFWTNTISPWFSKEKWQEMLSGVTKAFDFIFNGGVIKIVVDALNRIITSINDAFSFEINILGKSYPMSLNIPLIELPQYRNGGFPEDGLFMANHNELVGGFSNGKTAVANNGQIIDGIEGGVERAVSRVLAPYLADIARNTRETADKDMSVNIGDRDIARANNRGQRQIGARLITEG